MRVINTATQFPINLLILVLFPSDWCTFSTVIRNFSTPEINSDLLECSSIVSFKGSSDVNLNS